MLCACAGLVRHYFPLPDVLPSRMLTSLMGCKRHAPSFRSPELIRREWLRSIHVDARALRRIFDRAAENFLRQGSGFPLTQKYKAEQIDHRIDVGPVKVGMRNASGDSLQM